MVNTYFQAGLYLSGMVALIVRIFWSLALIFYIFQLRNVYLLQATGNKFAGTQAQSNEMGVVRSNLVGARVDVGGKDVAITVDQKTTASVASKAYSSGAAGVLIGGTKAKVDANGNIVLDIDRNAAGKAAMKYTKQVDNYSLISRRN